ncbi:MAG: 3-dehydroquinate synthase, partial [Limnochordia bacterium]
MAAIPVRLKHTSYEVRIGVGVRHDITSLTAPYDKAVIITDENVNRLYGELFDFPKIVTASGEQAKTWENAKWILAEMAALGLTRRSVVLALGGGVVGDVAGFCAAIYMRGIPYIQIPTTLLAQVDSAVGGKTAVDLPGGKNLVGAFHQPTMVVVDPTFLATLSRRELVCGLGEVVKYAVIAEPWFVETLKARAAAICKEPHTALEDIIIRCCAVKARLVEEDELDRGARKQLNAGHTIAHALESATGFVALSHGEAVLVGLAAEARLAHRLGLLSQEDLAQIEEACRLVGMPSVPVGVSLQQFMEALTRDKKNTAAGISFMLPRRLGEVAEVFLTPDEVEQLLPALLPLKDRTAAPGRELGELRERINHCDAVIAQAFRQRLQLIDEVAQYKRRHALPIYDPKRETEILGKFTGETHALFREILRISRGRQSRALFPFNIALIGFMGVGKSTVGPLLADALGREFIDLDRELERRWGMSISQMFAEVGEAEFRRRERELLQEVCRHEAFVIACGGGAVLEPANLAALKATSKLVLLTAPLDTIVERIGHMGDRPLLGSDPYAAAAQLMAQRAPLYQRAADLTVATEHRT